MVNMAGLGLPFLLKEINMGQWDDKFVRAEAKWDSWSMQEYAKSDRVLANIIEDRKFISSPP